MQPDISVVLPTYNREQSILRAVASVLEQTYRGLELIIVDDCSTDNTASLVRSVQDQRVRYYRLERRVGAGGARNRGIELANAPAIAFQDSDDEWEKDKLSLQMECLTNDSGGAVGVVYSDMVRIREDASTVLFPAPEVNSDRIFDTTTGDYSVVNIGIGSCLIRRCFLDQSGPFNEQLPALEDLELLIRLSRCCRFVRIAKPLVKYYASDGISSDLLRLASARRMLLNIYKHELAGNKKAIVSQLVHIAHLEGSR